MYMYAYICKCMNVLYVCMYVYTCKYVCMYVYQCLTHNVVVTLDCFVYGTSACKHCIMDETFGSHCYSVSIGYL